MLVSLVDKVSNLLSGATTHGTKSLTNTLTAVKNVTVNLPNILVTVKQVYIALLVIAVGTLVLTVILVVFLIGYPRLWLPKVTRLTRGKVAQMIREIVKIVETLKTSTHAASSRYKNIIEHPAYILLSSMSDDIKTTMNMYFRFYDELKLKHLTPDGLIKKNASWCYPNSDAEVLYASLSVHAYTSRVKLKLLYDFYTSFQAFRQAVNRCATDDIRVLLLDECYVEESKNKNDGDPLARLIANDLKKTTPQEKSLSFGDDQVLIQELNALLTVEHDEFVSLFTARKTEIEKSMTIGFFDMVHACAQVEFYNIIGDSVRRRWHDGIKLILFPADGGKCSFTAFKKAFSMEFANKYWLAVMMEPMQKYLKKSKKRNARIQENFASKTEACTKRKIGNRDPFSSLSKGFSKVFKFILDFFWFIGFVLSHMQIFVQLILSFILATLLWIALAFLAAPGVNYAAWNIYFVFSRIKPSFVQLVMLMLTLIIAGLMYIVEITIRIITGGFFSHTIFTNVQCRPPLLNTWHNVSPVNDAYNRFFGCRLPCAIGYSPDDASGDAFCKRDENWKPGMCPQQQAYRLYRSKGSVGKLANIVDPVLSHTKYSHMNTKDATMMTLKDVGKTAQFLEECSKNKNLQPYRDLTRVVCSNMKALEQSPGLTKVCQAAMCIDNGDKLICDRLKVYGSKFHGLFSDVDDSKVICKDISNEYSWIDGLSAIRKYIILACIILLSITISSITLLYLLKGTQSKI